MKLRILDNSVRLRLERRELQQLLQEGAVVRNVVFSDEATFSYTLRLADQDQALRAVLGGNRIEIFVDRERAIAWAVSDEAGIQASQSTKVGELQLLVEKDFPCKHGEREDLSEKFAPGDLRASVKFDK